MTEATAIKPTTGRIVHYGLDHDAAIIVHVWSEESVNLGVFDHNGQAEGRTSVLRSDEPAAYKWHWPERD